MSTSRKKLRLVLIPQGTEQPKHFVLSRRGFLLLLFMLPALSGIGFYLILSGKLQSRDHPLLRARLNQENDTLAYLLKRLNYSTDSLEAKLQSPIGGELDSFAIEGLDKNELFGLTKPVKQGLRRMSHASNVNTSLREAELLSIRFDSLIVVLKREQKQSYQWPIAYPVAPKNRLTRGFGFFTDPFTGRKAHHLGIDFSGSNGDPIYAPAHATVLSIENDPFWGISLRLEHQPGSQTFYAHLRSVAVKKGQFVERGQVIAAMGASGIVSGVHLHFELTLNNREVNPEEFWLRPSEIVF